MVDQTYEPSRADWSPDPGAFNDAVEQLDAYFAGELTEFDIELDLRGYRIPAASVEGAADNSVWRNPVVRRNRRTDRCARRRTRRRDWPTATIPSRSSFPATASSVPTAASPATAAGSIESERCSNWRRTRIGEFDVIRLDHQYVNAKTPPLPGVFLCMFGGVLLFHPIGQYHRR